MTPYTVLTVAELLARVAAGERDFSSLALDMEEADFSGAILDGVNLSDGWFHASNFRSASLRGTVIHRSNLKCCDFSGADLTGIDFTDSALEGSTWESAILDGVQFETVDLYGSILSADEFVHHVSTSPYET
jgi:uncharacterized protein YjbI with pentapeptide repeats